MSVGTKLKAAREAADMTQEELADKCGVERTHIVNVEHDRCAPSLGLLAKITRALKMDANDVVRAAWKPAP